MHDPTDIVIRLAAEARRHTTPCGDGEMTWHSWRSHASGSAYPVVLLHGGSGSWTHWIKTIPHLQACREVVAGDIPGLGDSAMPPEPHTPRSCADVVAAGLARLVPADRPIHLVGFSFGAHVGTLAACSMGARLASLTLVGSAALGLPRTMLSYPKERSSMTKAERDGVHRKTLEILMFLDPSRIDDAAIAIQAENVRRSRFRSRQFATTDEVYRRLPGVRGPVNAIWGDKDMTAEIGPEACYEAIRTHHPDLVSRTIANSGHWVMYEQADAFNAALAEVLAMRETAA